jgi:hypothetical protein
MIAAALAVAWLLLRNRPPSSARAVRWAAMNLFFAVTIGTMAFGHLLVVTIKLAIGTLQGSAIVFYAIGVALALPSWWLVVHAPRLAASENGNATALMLNAWLGVSLLAMGLHHLPLAAPAILNIGYARHTRPLVGHAIVATAIVFNTGLFIGSLIFLASGQSFEQFRGIE